MRSTDALCHIQPALSALNWAQLSSSVSRKARSLANEMSTQLAPSCSSLFDAQPLCTATIGLPGAAAASRLSQLKTYGPALSPVV